MIMQRRQLLVSSAALAVTAWLRRGWATPAPKRILVLGGSSFVGPAVVEAALAAGHTVTMFNRGTTSPELFPHVEKLRGFRSSDPDDQDLSALAHRHFDVAIDVWPNDPAVVTPVATLLSDRVRHYMFVSSIAVYSASELDKASIDETAPVEPWHGKARPYSRGKAESERRLQAIFGNRLTIVRPGPIKGDRDTTPDLLAWLVRTQSGGKHIGPGTGGDPVELVDVKDVARFLLLAIDRSLHGTFNLTGRPRTFAEFIDACKAVTRSEAQFVWIGREFLHQHGLETDATLGIHGGNFPFWRPAGDSPGLYRISSDKAFRAGWTLRSFDETALDCLAYYRSTGAIRDWTDYLSADKEQAVLDAWAHRSP
jgi:2'-hydroxyisoflavone reductase